LIERQSECEARAGTRPTQNRFADSSITAPPGARQRRSNLARILDLPRKRP
jgi:hypothetical protein